jgi:hypothetical protein
MHFSFLTIGKSPPSPSKSLRLATARNFLQYKLCSAVHFGGGEIVLLPKWRVSKSGLRFWSKGWPFLLVTYQVTCIKLSLIIIQWILWNNVYFIILQHITHTLSKIYFFMSMNSLEHSFSPRIEMYVHVYSVLVRLNLFHVYRDM